MEFDGLPDIDYVIDSKNVSKSFSVGGFGGGLMKGFGSWGFGGGDDDKKKEDTPKK